MDSDESEIVIMNEKQYLNRENLPSLVKTYINTNVSANDLRLIAAFLRSIELDLGNVIAQIIVYGINMNLAFIQAMEKGNITGIVYLIDQIDTEIAERLKQSLANTGEDQDGSLESCLYLLFDKKNKYNILGNKYLSQKYLSSIAQTLKEEFPKLLS